MRTYSNVASAELNARTWEELAEQLEKRRPLPKKIKMSRAAYAKFINQIPIAPGTQDIGNIYYNNLRIVEDPEIEGEGICFDYDMVEVFRYVNLTGDSDFLKKFPLPDVWEEILNRPFKF